MLALVKGNRYKSKAIGTSQRKLAIITEMGHKSEEICTRIGTVDLFTPDKLIQLTFMGF